MRKSNTRFQMSLSLVFLLSLGLVGTSKAEITFETLVEQVKLNEAKYKNIDLKIDYIYQSGPAAPRISIPEKNEVLIYATSQNSIWYVNQENKYRVEVEEENLFQDGSSRNSNHIKMYDGKLTRLLEQDHIVNLIQGYTGDNYHIRPHMLFLRGPYFYMPLSTLLSGDKAIADSPDANWSPENSLEYAYQGEADFNGLKCHQVWATILRNKKPVRRLEFWLAADRNFIPARYCSYQLKLSEDQPTVEGEVLEWIEVSPGFWFPKETKTTSFSPYLLKRGQKIVQWTKKYQTKEVSLTPRHELSFFQNLEIPAGALVYEIENRKIIKSYKKGSASDPESADTPADP
ncbi:hypothetical protein Mal35_07590 [Gimesia maris]|uniref:hypothetical protein n=1 Tax=Gimesia maris TaxID=122 RepID=UPI00118CEAD1|nr:hypothetical protein [Gimesia maris]QDT77333.1 hypothetical protein Mal35_07590 [Gimesia maris]